MPVFKETTNSTMDLKDRFISDYEELRTLIKEYRKLKKRIVLTQGVFDLVHEGHALYLEKARSYGDILIVGVDTDELTRKRKGPHRPIVPEQERLSMLLHLRHVDIVTLRDAEHEIGALIKLVCPDVLVTSESTVDFSKIGPPPKAYQPYCKQIVTLPHQATTSTTARVRLLSIQGADQLANHLIENIPKLVNEALAGIRGGKS
jgi:D-glycero-beta-D-manno-heptose 1-phosphate adenylyltransferase